MSTDLEKKVPTFKKKKKILGSCWAKIGLSQKLANCLIRSGDIPSPGQKIDRQDKHNDCVMNSARGALGRGSDPPFVHTVHNTAGDTWRAQDRGLIHFFLSTGV